jgi:hypothetical protein
LLNKAIKVLHKLGRGLAINLDALVINIIASTIIVSPALWLSGRLIVGGQKAKFSDAVLTVVIGTLIGGILGGLFSGLLAAIAQLIIWLALVRHYFDCGWGAALAISIVGVILFGVVAVVLGLIGITLFAALF